MKARGFVFQANYRLVSGPGGARFPEVQLYGHTNQGAWISFALSATAGGFYSGDRTHRL